MNNEICLLFNHGITQFTCKSGRPPSPPSSSSSSSSSSSGSSSTFLRARTQPSTVGTAMGPACFNYCTTTGTVTYIPALHHMQSSYIYSPSPIHRATRPTDLCVSLSGEFDRQRARMGSCRVAVVLLWVVANAVCFLPTPSSAQLRRNYYANICPNVENIVRSAVTKKVRQTFVTIPGTLRLFFHDCLVQGCDASVIIQSTANNKAEKDNPENLSLAGDGFDTVIKAKAAVDAVPQCRNKVSCADVLAMATRDVIALAGGPWYAVELGRLDGLSSTAASVTGKLPQPEFNLDQLTSMFASHGLTRADLVALSGAHTLGFAHCGRFAHRIYNFSRSGAVDPTLNRNYAAQLRGMCPRVVDPTIAINMDPVTPRSFDNQYYRNLQQGKGLFTSDQVLYSDRRSRPLVNAWARNKPAFNRAFVTAITKLGRVGVKTHSYQAPSNLPTTFPTLRVHGHVRHVKNMVFDKEQKKGSNQHINLQPNSPAAKSVISNSWNSSFKKGGQHLQIFSIFFAFILQYKGRFISC